MYEEHYHFSAKPFQLSPDPRFFFASKEHQRAMSYLKYGLEQGEGFIVITGPIGTGKSTLARNLLSQLSDHALVANQLVTTNLTPNELLHAIATGFGLTGHQNDKVALLKQLEDFLITLHHQGKRALLLVDEAQNLPPESIEELRMLSNFQQADKPLLQSFLLGQEELRLTLQSASMEQFRQRVIASCHLAPLNEEETWAYITHRLSQVGWQGTPAWPAESAALVHQFTQGIPRKINVLCDRILLAGYLEESTLISPALVEHTAAEQLEEFRVPSALPPLPAQQSMPLTESTPAHAGRPVDHDADSAAVQHFQRHLQEVYHYLEKTLASKLQLLKYLDRNIDKKYERYRKLKQKVATLEEEYRQFHD